MQTERENQIEVGTALATLGLGLSGEELTALTKQGFVCAEYRGHGRTRYKLRFRIGTKQHVRYLGTAPEFVDQVRTELGQLQQCALQHRELKRLVRMAKHKLRTAKHLLEPLLHNAGFAFHGLSIRKPRSGVRP
jgi:hypothetical protein